MRCVSFVTFLAFVAAAHAFTLTSPASALWVSRSLPRVRHRTLKALSWEQVSQLQQNTASEFDVTHLEALLAQYKRTVTHRFKGAIRAMRILERPMKRGSVVDAQRLMERFYAARQKLWTDIESFQQKAVDCLAQGDRPLALHYLMGAELLRFLDPISKMASVYLYTAQNDDLAKVERMLKAAAIVGPDPETIRRAEALKQQEATEKKAARRSRKAESATSSESQASTVQTEVKEDIHKTSASTTELLQEGNETISTAEQNSPEA